MCQRATLAEIYIAGSSLTRGLSQPAGAHGPAAHLPNPFSAPTWQPNVQDGRSGSLAARRYDRVHLPDSLGRSDQLVKIPSVSVSNWARSRRPCADFTPRCARLFLVRRRDSGRLSRALVAHVIPELDRAPPADELRAYLREIVAIVLRPSLYDFRDKLPRLLNGKVDRRALALSARMRAAESDRSGPSLPRTEFEQQLSRIWAKVLDVKKWSGSMMTSSESAGWELAPRDAIVRADSQGLRADDSTQVDPPSSRRQQLPRWPRSWLGEDAIAGDAGVPWGATPSRR